MSVPPLIGVASRRPVVPEEVKAARGVVVSAPYDYLVGTHSGLADEMGIVNKSLQARAKRARRVWRAVAGH